jgi:hypothetical protein
MSWLTAGNRNHRKYNCGEEELLYFNFLIEFGNQTFGERRGKTIS